jgi:uncharacterized membrane protein YesL
VNLFLFILLHRFEMPGAVHLKLATILKLSSVKSTPVKSAPDQIIVLLCFFLFNVFHPFFLHREITCPPFLLFPIVNKQYNDNTVQKDRQYNDNTVQKDRQYNDKHSAKRQTIQRQHST